MIPRTQANCVNMPKSLVVSHIAYPTPLAATYWEKVAFYKSDGQSKGGAASFIHGSQISANMPVVSTDPSLELGFLRRQGRNTD
jgi:hypothetical protein